MTLRRQANADESTYLKLKVESIDLSLVSVVNSRRLKVWPCLSSQPLGRLVTAGDFINYHPHTREEFVTKICLAQGIKLSTKPSSLRIGLAFASNEMQEVSSAPISISLAQVLACQSWIVT